MSLRYTSPGTDGEVRCLTPFFVGVTRVSDFTHRTDIEMVPVVSVNRGKRA